jgi:hypothetical protein
MRVWAITRLNLEEFERMSLKKRPSGEADRHGLISLLAGGTGIRPGVFRRWAEAQPETFFGMPLFVGGSLGPPGGVLGPKKRTSG